MPRIFRSLVRYRVVHLGVLLAFVATSDMSAQTTGRVAKIVTPTTFNDSALNQVGTTKNITSDASLFVSGPAPWIDVTAPPYNAVADSKTVSDGHTTSGSSTLTSSTANFVSGDMGKPILVSGCGGGGGPLRTTISVVTSATTVTLSASCSTTQTTAFVRWSTDNSTAINNAVQACATASLSGCTIFFPATGTGSYFIGSTVAINKAGAPASALNGMRLLGDCSALGSGLQILNKPQQSLHCSTIVAYDPNFDMVVVGSTTTFFNTFGFAVEDLAFADGGGGAGLVSGAIRLVDVNNFNLTNLACSGFTNGGSAPTPNALGYCVLLDGEPITSGSQGETQYGVIVSPSVSNTRFPIQTTGTTLTDGSSSGISEINLYGGYLDCGGATSQVLANSIGIDIASTFIANHGTATVANGEWGIFNTHILNCQFGVAAVNTSVTQWFGVAELMPNAVSNSVGFQLDASNVTGAQSSGNLIGGSINNYQTGVAIGTTYTTNFPANNEISASITNTPTAQFSIALTSQQSTLRLTPSNVRSMPQLHGSVTLKDEFVNTGAPATSAGPYGELGWTVNTAGTVAPISGQTNHPGILQRVSPGGTSNTYVQLSAVGASPSLPIAALSGNLVWDSTFIFSVEQATGETIRVGFCQTCGLTGAPGNGIYFENSSVTSNKWNGVTKASATTANQCSGSSLALDTSFHTLEIRNDGMNIYFVFDGTQCGSILATDASVPTTNLVPFFSIASTDTTQKKMDIDAFQFNLQVQR